MDGWMDWVFFCHVVVLGLLSKKRKKICMLRSFEIIIIAIIIIIQISQDADKQLLSSTVKGILKFAFYSYMYNPQPGCKTHFNFWMLSKFTTIDHLWNILFTEFRYCITLCIFLGKWEGTGGLVISQESEPAIFPLKSVLLAAILLVV